MVKVCPLFKEIVCLYVFPPDPTLFPGTGELCSNHFYQHITFVNIIFPGLFGLFLILRKSILKWNATVLKTEFYVKINQSTLTRWDSAVPSLEEAAVGLLVWCS